ncbi:MAG: endonuclease NucS [Candidatus Bathyarchaeia archaeon]
MKLDRIELYLGPDSSRSPRAQGLISLLEEIRKKWMMEYVVICTEQLSTENMNEIEREIRSIPPQVRGRIVSSRNHVLPLSRTKRLNLGNTPIILMRKNGLPVDVYPHLLGTKYYSPEDFLEKILRVGPVDYLEARGILEDPLVKIVADCPNSLEEGMTFLGADLQTDAGVIDALLKDRLENFVVVEAETRAKDSSVAQVCRLSAGYARSMNVPPDKIRKIVVCLSFEGQLAATCEGSNVELYRLEFKRVI